MNWKATTNAAWLTMNPASGSGNGSITLTAITNSLATGVYNAIVTLSAGGTTAITIPVALTVAAAPVPAAIGISPSSLSFTVQQGAGNPPAQMLSVRNTGGGTFTWTASENVEWLTLSPASGTGNNTVTVSAATGSLAVGTYTGTITVGAAGATNVSVPVTFTVTTAPVPPAIGASPTSLSFTGQQGAGNPATQTVSISNTGGGILTWTAREDASWLHITPSSGTGNGSITATASIGSLAVGTTYNTMITVSAPGASPRSIPIAFTVTAPPSSVSLNPTSLTFSGVQGGLNPASQTVTVNANGNWTASSNASWLVISPSSGSGNGSISASVALPSATNSTNSATITVTNGSVSTTTTVTLTVTAASLTISPNSLTYTATAETTPASQTITVHSNGAWTASGDAPWLLISPPSGSNNGTITARVNTTGLTKINNSATITITSGNFEKKTIAVTLTLNAPSSTSATLTWTANRESDLAGYRVYQTTTPGAYEGLEAIVTLRGNVTTYQVTGLQKNTYYFVVTAYDTAGNESAHSNEVSKSIY